jgi:hypothetical protein
MLTLIANEWIHEELKRRVGHCGKAHPDSLPYYQRKSVLLFKLLDKVNSSPFTYDLGCLESEGSNIFMCNRLVSRMHL